MSVTSASLTSFPVSSVSAAEFSAALAQCFGATPVPRHLAVALSGGADSLALTLLLADYASATGRRLTALIVDHGLRPESAAEARHVAQILQKRGIAHDILTWKPENSRTTQHRARQARYRLLTEWCHHNAAGALFLGHHREDQAETFWLRLAAGSGTDGLACMAPLRREGAEGLVLARPLLGFSKLRLRETCAAFGETPVEDASNAKPAYSRNILRLNRDALPFDAEKTLRLVDVFARLRRHMCRLTQDALQGCAVFYAAGYAVFDLQTWQKLPQELQKRTLHTALMAVSGRGYPLRTRTLMTALEAARSRKNGVLTCGGCILETEGGRLTLCREAAAVTPVPVTTQETQFDGRLRLRFDAPLPENAVLHVLGRRGVSFLPKEQRKIYEKRRRALPRFARQSLVTVEKHGRILALPQLGWLDAGVFPKNGRISAEFFPNAPIFAIDIEIV